MDTVIDIFQDRKTCLYIGSVSDRVTGELLHRTQPKLFVLGAHKAAEEWIRNQARVAQGVSDE